MTGYDIYERAMTLLGATDAAGNVKDGQSIVPVALEAVNRIGEDLFSMEDIKNIFDEIDTDQKTAGVMVYGVAMLLALTFGDAVQNKVFCELYNSLRGSVKSHVCGVKDVLPVAQEGY